MRLNLISFGVIIFATLCSATIAMADRHNFDEWCQELRIQALNQGIRAEIFDAAFSDIEPIQRVIELDRNQPEFTMTFEQYLSRVINDQRVKEGREKFSQNRNILEEISRKFGVQPRFIVALWGIETGYGRHTGGFPVIASLATLAFDGRRSSFFRKELLISLNILNEGHINSSEMNGSWAGAMGQNQFMPSSFSRHAIDYDGDGKRDIWTSKADVFASTANYLAASGWRDDITWGREVIVPDNFDLSLTGRKNTKLIGEWQNLGVRLPDGGELPKRQLKSSIIIPDNGKPVPAFLVYDNFEAILKWNRSDFFALAVGSLSDRIAGR